MKYDSRCQFSEKISVKRSRIVVQFITHCFNFFSQHLTEKLFYFLIFILYYILCYIFRNVLENYKNLSTI